MQRPSTYARLFKLSTNKLLAETEAKCSEKDNFNKNTGRKIALTRLLESKEFINHINKIFSSISSYTHELYEQQKPVRKEIWNKYLNKSIIYEDDSSIILGNCENHYDNFRIYTFFLKIVNKHVINFELIVYNNMDTVVFEDGVFNTIKLEKSKYDIGTLDDLKYIYKSFTEKLLRNILDETRLQFLGKI